MKMMALKIQANKIKISLNVKNLLELTLGMRSEATQELFCLKGPEEVVLLRLSRVQT